MKKLLFISMALLLMSLKCKKDTVLPDQTNTGANKFGCNINGILFTPSRNSALNLSPLTTIYRSSNIGDYFDLTASETNPPDIIEIQSNGIIIQQNTIYPIGNFTNTSGVIARYVLGNKNYNIIVPLSGQLKITYLDTNAKIISGTFFFDAIDKDGNKVEVRSGVFDVKYQ